jgi:hypothetical protein
MDILSVHTGWKPVLPTKYIGDAGALACSLIQSFTLKVIFVSEALLLANHLGATGVSPVRAQAKACGYRLCLIDAQRPGHRLVEPGAEGLDVIVVPV